jgi:very-short-patch-repair endonuclease
MIIYHLYSMLRWRDTAKSGGSPRLALGHGRRHRDTKFNGARENVQVGVTEALVHLMCWMAVAVLRLRGHGHRAWKRRNDRREKNLVYETYTTKLGVKKQI